MIRWVNANQAFGHPFFRGLVLPAIAIAVVAYFGSYAIWGERGLLALEDTQAQLGVQQEQLAQIDSRRDRLEHRIQLMEDGMPIPIWSKNWPAAS